MRIHSKIASWLDMDRVEEQVKLRKGLIDGKYGFIWRIDKFGQLQLSVKLSNVGKYFMTWRIALFRRSKYVENQLMWRIAQIQRNGKKIENVV